MARIMTLSVYFLLAFCLLCAGLVTLNRFGSIDVLPTGGLRPVEPITRVGAVPAGNQAEVMIEIENSSEKTVTVLGATQACSPQCCAKADGLPMRVQGHGRGLLRLRLVAPRGGRGYFHLPITIYTDLDGGPEVTLELRGSVIASSTAPPGAG